MQHLRQSAMMPFNLAVGILGGLCAVFLLDVTETHHIVSLPFGGAIAFAIFSLLMQVSDLGRKVGSLSAGMFFTGGVLTAAYFVRQRWPNLVPEVLASENMRYVVIAAMALIGILVACLWAALNPRVQAPVPPWKVRRA